MSRVIYNNGCHDTYMPSWVHHNSYIGEYPTTLVSYFSFLGSI